MSTLKALIFDVDGTLAETEEVHREAFNLAFAEAGLSWRWDRNIYGRLLRTTGGRERIEVYASETGATEVASAELHRRKTFFYNNWITANGIDLRPGVARLIGNARRQGILLAIATTTSRANVESLLAKTLGPHSAGWFDAICCGEDVARKKPDPEVYLAAISRLGLGPEACIAFEDSANGLKSARAAGLTTVVTPSIYTVFDDFDGAELNLHTLDEPLSFRQNPKLENLSRLTRELITLLSR